MKNINTSAIILIIIFITITSAIIHSVYFKKEVENNIQLEIQIAKKYCSLKDSELEDVMIYDDNRYYKCLNDFEIHSYKEVCFKYEFERSKLENKDSK